MGFNATKHISEQENIQKKITDLKNSEPILPSIKTGDISLNVKIFDAENGGYQSIVEVAQGEKSIAISNAEHLDIINFLRDIYQ